jgi:probable rRNA maturation factor
MIINIYNQTIDDIKTYEKVLNHVFSMIEEEKAINIIMIYNQHMHEMNLQYRGLDKPTDVLSFPYEESFIDVLGDIFINLDYMKQQAFEYGHSEAREIAFLAVHGYLHVKGYDHHTIEEEKVMFEKQEAILKQAGLERNHD